MYNNTNNHNPPYNFEYVFNVKNTKYILTCQVLRDNKRIAYVTFGRLTAKRMRPFVVKASDYKLLFNTIFEIFGDIFNETRKVKAFYVSFPSGYDRVSKGFMMLLKRFMNRNPSFKLKLYMRSTEDRTDFLVVRKPYDDKRILGGEGFSEATISRKPLKRVSPIKIELKVAGNEIDNVEVDVIDDEILKKLEENPKEFENIPSVFNINEDYIRKAMNKGEIVKWMMKESYTKFLKKNEKYREYGVENFAMIHFFTGIAYRTLHYLLREGSGIGHLDTESQKIQTHYIRKMFRFFEELPELDENIRVIRVLDYNAFKTFYDLNAGDIYVDPGVTYTSVIPFSGNLDDRSVVMNILIPKGSKCMILNGMSKYPEEYEITLPPGSVFKIISKKRNPEGMSVGFYVEAVYIGNVSKHVEKEAMKFLENYEFPQLEVGNKINSDIIYYVVGKDTYLVNNSFGNFGIVTLNSDKIDTSKTDVPDIVKWVDVTKTINDLEEGKVYAIGLIKDRSLVVEVLDKIDKNKVKARNLKNGRNINLLDEHTGVAELDKEQAYALYDKS